MVSLNDCLQVFVKDTKAIFLSPDSDIDFFDIVIGVLLRDSLASFLLIICLDYVLGMSIDLMKENGFILKKAKIKQYLVENLTDADYADDLALIIDTHVLKSNLCCTA